MRALLAPLAALALLAAAPSPSPSPSASPEPARLFVVCRLTPFYVFNNGDNLPRRADTPEAMAGQVFEAHGARSTLGNFDYIETNVKAIGPNFAGESLYLWKGCVVIQ